MNFGNGWQWVLRQRFVLEECPRAEAREIWEEWKTKTNHDDHEEDE